MRILEVKKNSLRYFNIVDYCIVDYVVNFIHIQFMLTIHYVQYFSSNSTRYMHDSENK